MATTKHPMKIDTAPTPNGWLLLAAAACIAASSGCTSVIGSAYLREAWLDAVEHAAEPTPRSKDDTEATGRRAAGSSAPDDEATADGDGAEAEASAAWAPATLDEAADEADRRLARSGGLTEAARGTLIATLEGTPRQDWPIVIEEFTAALAAVQTENARSVGTVTPPPDAAPAAVVEPVAPLPPAAPAPAAVPELSRPISRIEPAQAEPTHIEPSPPGFAIRNACFASRVRGWGVVDRFDTAEFAPGQEVIVYFELDQLSSRESSDGHTTRIDTMLRLVDADGRRIHEWTFEPLEETCSSRRHDYFARYLLSLPESTPSGSLRLELSVSDTIAGRTAHATLPLAGTRR